ncbi:MAG TPA: hypothetical protein VE978_03595 [Chitinophagales bacterium]|nr:hypothetical protein [Chitinophagales bacterium]
MQTSRFIIIIEFVLLCLTAFFTYNLHHQFVTGLNPYIQAVAISLFFILIVVNAYFIFTAAVDTLTLEGKRKYLLNQVLYDNRPNDIDYDTLIDLNYDGNEDYMIGYRNEWIEVFLLNPSTNSYIEDERLSSLKHASFFLDKRKITSFVSLNSGESGKQLEWINDDWKVTKEISGMDSGRWEISFPLKGTSKIVYSDGPLSSSHLLEIDDKRK